MTAAPATAGRGPMGADSVSKRDSFLLRIDPRILAALRKWSDDELRSVNGQIEFLLRKALRDAGRLKSEMDREGEAREAKE